MKECCMDLTIRECQYGNGSKCFYKERCSFQKEKIVSTHQKEKYVRKERWYERYTMGKNSLKNVKCR